MSFDTINSLLPKNAANQREQAIELTRKWETTGVLEGLDGPGAGNMAQLLENQASQLVTEANRTGTQGGSEEWNGVALPLVRRVFSDIVAKEFISVQPMNLPSGLIFYLDFKYGSAQAGFNTGAGRDSQNDSLFGVTDASKGTETATGGFYGAGRFGYTINDVTSNALKSGSAANTTDFTVVDADLDVDLNFNTVASSSFVAASATIKKVTISVDALDGFDAEGVRAFTLSNETGDFLGNVYAEFTKIDKVADTISFIVSEGDAVASADRVQVSYHKQPTDVTRGDFEEGKTGEDPLDIPTIDLQLRSEPIVAKTRKLKAQWTPEFAQDLARYQNIDAEAELTALLSDYIAQEIDFELLDMLIQNAQSSDVWSARLGFEYNPATNALSQTAPNIAAYNQGTWFQTLGTKIQKMSNKIHQLTLRGGANFLVVSPSVATILESIPGYAADTDGNQSTFAMGVRKVGTLNSRFTVYKNPYMTENIILMGYQGSQFLETGAVYAPYIPIMMTPLIHDPENFTPRKGVMTRYAKKMVRPEFYGKIYVEGLDRV
jgi:hypothetical protein